MTGETHPRDRYPGTGDRALLKKTKMAYLEKFGFLVQQEPWPTVGLTLKRIEATETHTVGYKAAGATLGATDGPRACQGRKTMRIKHRCRHGRRAKAQLAKPQERPPKPQQEPAKEKPFLVGISKKPQNSKLLNATTDQEQTMRTLRRRVEAWTMPRPLCLCKKNAPLKKLAPIKAVSTLFFWFLSGYTHVLCRKTLIK